MRVAVTGAYGYSGQYMARRLLEQGHEVLTLTNSTRRSNPFGEKVRAQPFNFSDPALLEQTLRGVDVLINNYWVRFDLPPLFTFAGAVLHAKTLFEAAKRAGVARIVHISITNPERNGSSLLQRQSQNGRPSQVDGFIPLHPAADSTVWQRGYLDQQHRLVPETSACLRHFWRRSISPATDLRGRLAEAAVLKVHERINETIDAIGPETFHYRDMVEMIAAAISGGRASSSYRLLSPIR